MIHCSNFVLLEFNPFGDATFNLDFRMLLLCLCCSMILLTIFQVVFWTCVWGLSLFVFQSHKTLHVEDAMRTQHILTCKKLPPKYNILKEIFEIRKKFWNSQKKFEVIKWTIFVIIYPFVLLYFTRKFLFTWMISFWNVSLEWIFAIYKPLSLFGGPPQSRVCSDRNMCWKQCM